MDTTSQGWESISVLDMWPTIMTVKISVGKKYYLDSHGGVKFSTQKNRIFILINVASRFKSMNVSAFSCMYVKDPDPSHPIALSFLLPTYKFSEGVASEHMHRKPIWGKLKG